MTNGQGILVVVSGFSGAGKGTLMKALLEKYHNYALSISATTRSPREGEQDGREYFFVKMCIRDRSGGADHQTKCIQSADTGKPGKYYFKMYREEAGASLSFCGRGDRGSKTGADPSR